MGGILNRVGSGLGLLMSGPDDPMLGQRENAQARRFGIMQTGLGMLGAPTGTPTLQSLAQASLFGQQQGQGYRGQAYQMRASAEQAKQREMLAQSLTSPDAIMQAMQYATRTGDVNLANAAINAYKTMQTEPKDPFKIVGNAVFYPDTKEWLTPPPKDEPFKPGAVHVSERPETGQPEQWIFNEKGEREWLGTKPETRPPSPYYLLSERQAGISNRASIQRDYRIAAEPERTLAIAITNARGAPPNNIGDQTRVAALAAAVQPTANQVTSAEFDRVASGGGYRAVIERYANRVLSGGELPGDVREAIDKELERLGTQRQSRFKFTLDAFRDQARDAGLDPDEFIEDPYRSIPKIGDDPAAAWRIDLREILRTMGTGK